MKKIIGIAVIAVTLLFSSTNMSSNEDVDLATLISIDSAGPELDGTKGCYPGSGSCDGGSWCKTQKTDWECTG